MGLGIVGARRMMDGFDITTSATHGTTVVLRKRLPRRGTAADPQRRRPHQPAARVGAVRTRWPTRCSSRITSCWPRSRNCAQRQEDLSRLNAELQDTNRGVVALYAELDEKAEHLRRADEMKSKFLSNMTHEFQTPLNSILALTRLLLERVDGELSEEQEKQVRFIRQASRGSLGAGRPTCSTSPRWRRGR